MKAILSRAYDNLQTRGCLAVFDDACIKYKCHTLELPNLGNQHDVSCIPEGHYRVDKISSLKHGNCFEILGVPNRSAILIHKGNFAAGGKKDTRGCILPGLEFQDINGDGNLDIVNSTEAMNKLLEVLPQSFDIWII